MNVIEFALAGENLNDQRAAVGRVRFAVDDQQTAGRINFAYSLGRGNSRGPRAYDGITYVDVVWH